MGSSSSLWCWASEATSGLNVQNPKSYSWRSKVVRRLCCSEWSIANPQNDYSLASFFFSIFLTSNLKFNKCALKFAKEILTQHMCSNNFQSFFVYIKYILRSWNSTLTMQSANILLLKPYHTFGQLFLLPMVLKGHSFSKIQLWWNTVAKIYIGFAVKSTYSNSF